MAEKVNDVGVGLLLIKNPAQPHLRSARHLGRSDTAAGPGVFEIN